ncbi:hypothetical protein [uncultured Mediterranean phage uvDeep-CGR2-KM18-C74]|nr:hypothetical protein [uncultured Mediterranean phage uvDeep-CGR2-KM18-C74]
MSRSGAMDRIDALLGTVTDPAFVSVVRGEPLAISGTPALAYWITGREVNFMTLKDVTTNTDILIRAFFRMQISQDVRESLELDIWDAMVNIDSALRGDADLAGNVSDSNVGTISTGYTEMGGVAYRTVDIPFTVEIMGEVTITP